MRLRRRSRRTAPTTATRSRWPQGGCGALVVPGSAEPARLHRLGEVGRALQGARHERRDEAGVPAGAVDGNTAPAHGLGQARAVPFERRDEAGRESDRECGAPREPGRGDETVMVDEERVHREREGDRDEAKRLERRDLELLAGDVELAEDRDRRARPEDVEAERRQERGEQQHPEAGAEDADEVRAPARGRCPQRDGQENRGENGDGGELLGEQGRRGRRSQEERRRDGREAECSYSASAGISQFFFQL